MSKLIDKQCQACDGDIGPLKRDLIFHYFNELDDNWNIIDSFKLQREYHFKNFAAALEFTVKLGSLAEREGHHPDILLSWGKVVVDIYTHKVNNLTENDFILAAKCDLIEL